jgi:tRNA A37 threonylcarbamoyladenosine dehydratase
MPCVFISASARTIASKLQELGARKFDLMAKRYAHFAPEQLRAAANRLAIFSLRSGIQQPQAATQHID